MREACLINDCACRKRAASEGAFQEMAADVNDFKEHRDQEAHELAELDAEANRLAALISEYEMKLRDARSRFHAVDTHIGPLRLAPRANQMCFGNARCLAKGKNTKGSL